MVVVPFSGTLGVANDFVTTGAPTTVSTAVTAAAVTALSLVMGPVELVHWPICVPVTGKDIVQNALAPIVATSETTPGEVVTVLGLQDPSTTTPVVNVSPEGTVSVKLTPVRATALGFVTRMVTVDVPFSAIVVGENVFVTVGAGSGSTFTVTPTVAAPPQIPLLELAPPPPVAVYHPKYPIACAPV